MRTQTTHTHMYNHSLGKQVEGVHALCFITDVQSLYLMQACECFYAPILIMYICFILIRAYNYCVSVYMCTPPSCLPDSTYSLFTLLCSFSPPLPSLFLFSLLLLLSLSLCPAGTYMHVCRLCTVLAAVARANLTAMQPCVH